MIKSNRIEKKRDKQSRWVRQIEQKFSDQWKNQKINTKEVKIDEKIGAISTLYLSLAFSEVVVSGLVELLITECSVERRVGVD